MDGGLLVFIGYASSHGRKSLGLQLGEQHLLSYAVGLQALTVDVQADLLLVLAIDAHVGNGGYAA